MHRIFMPGVLALVALSLVFALPATASEEDFKKSIFKVGKLKPVDSELQVAVGDPMPDFMLETVDGGYAALGDYVGKQNLVISFVPAAWTPVCSDQWPGYNIMEDIFADYDATLLGVSVDNVPSQYAWLNQMGGVWFRVASDFWPHGELSSKLGILRSDGVSERALFLVDKEGVIRYIDVHDINSRPDVGLLLEAMKKL